MKTPTGGPDAADKEQAPTGSDPAVNAGPNPRALKGLPALCLVALSVAVAQAFGRFTVGVLLPAIRDHLGLSNTTAGTLAMTNVGAYLMGIVLVAATTSRFRLLVVMRAGMVLAASGLLLAAVAPGPLTVGLAMILLGIGGALTWIPAPAVAADAMPPEKRPFAIGVLGAGMGLGVVFTSQLGGFVRSTMGDESWRTVYLVQALIGVVALVALWLFIGHRQVAPSSKARTNGLSALRRMPGWLAFTGVMSTFGLLYLLVIAFLTTRLEDDNGWTSSRASFAFTLVGVAMIFGGPLAIALAGRIGARLAMAAGFAAWAVATILILPGWLVPTMAFSIAIGLIFSGVPIMIALYAVNNTTTEDYGPAFATVSIAFGAAQMVSPQIGGSLADATGSFTAVFLLSAGLAILGLGISLRLPRPTASVAAPGSG